MITLIAAASQNNVIGKDNMLPWHLPEDLKHFKNTTNGHVILMGSNTWKSFKGRPLPNRKHVIVTSKPTIVTATGLCVVTDLSCAISSAKILAKNQGQDEFFVIGGASIYEQTLPIADKIILTRIHSEFDGDTYFPVLSDNWIVTEGDRQQSKNGLEYTIQTYLKGNDNASR